MARTDLAAQDLVLAGITPSYSQATVDGFMLTPAGNDCFLHVKNTSAGSSTVTIQAPAKLDGIALTAPTVVVPATTGDKMIGPLTAGAFRQVADGKVYIDFSTYAAGVTAAFIRIPRT